MQNLRNSRNAHELLFGQSKFPKSTGSYTSMLLSEHLLFIYPSSRRIYKKIQQKRMVRLRIGYPSLRQAHNVITLTSFLWLFFSRVGFLPLYLQVYSHIALTDKKAENFRAFNLNSVRKKGSVTRTQYFHSKYFPKLFNKNQTKLYRKREGFRGQ